MEECDVGAAPRARLGSGAARVHPAQARAEVRAGRRSEPHAGPQVTTQQQMPQQRHARVPGFRFLAARAVGHGQQGGNRQHQPGAAYATGVSVSSTQGCA